MHRAPPVTATPAARAEGTSTTSGVPQDQREKGGQGMPNPPAGHSAQVAPSKLAPAADNKEQQQHRDGAEKVVGDQQGETGAGVRSPQAEDPAALENGVVVHPAAPLGAGDQDGTEPLATTQDPAPAVDKASGASLPTGEKNNEPQREVVGEPAVPVVVMATTETAVKAASPSPAQPSSYAAAAGSAVAENGVLSPPQPSGDKADAQVIVSKSEAAPRPSPDTAASPRQGEAGGAGWQQSPPISPARAARENGAKSPDSKPGAASTKKGGTAARKRSGSVSSRSDGAAVVGGAPQMSEADVPRTKVPRAELLGAVVARLAVRREVLEEDGGDAGSASGDWGGGYDDMSESDSGEEAGSDDGGGDRRRRRGGASETKHGEATVVRESVVTSFDGIEGRYVLVNAHDEEAKLTLEELEVALHQSQVRLASTPVVCTARLSMLLKPPPRVFSNFATRISRHARPKERP